ncbi:MAG: uracil-DNA glycosylase family protein [Kiritimatiellae bacterium]|nr:uracil-DNA glycosylase family protein [Kiritimatiellia bacterium]
MSISLPTLLKQIRACTLCAAHLPLGPRPVLQASSTARILIASQAPGIKVHYSGKPFTDPSGDRLRAWLNMASDVFYDERQIAIIPMGFCYPGRGKSGDLPPRPECAATWRKPLMERLPNIELTLVIGQYAMAYHLPEVHANVTETVRRWREFWPTIVPLPHPSPRNNLWLRRNPWFEEELIPKLQDRVANILAKPLK